LERRVRAAEEARKLSDLVVYEYADLVRSMEGRQLSYSPSTATESTASFASTSTVTLIDSLTEGKCGLKKLLEEFNAESARLDAEIAHLNRELSISQNHLATERANAAHDRSELSRALHELERLKIDDAAAVKMVSRYM